MYLQQSVFMRLHDDIGLNIVYKRIVLPSSGRSPYYVKTRHEYNANITNTKVANCARNTAEG